MHIIIPLLSTTFLTISISIFLVRITSSPLLAINSVVVVVVVVVEY